MNRCKKCGYELENFNGVLRCPLCYTTFDNNVVKSKHKNRHNDNSDNRKPRF